MEILIWLFVFGTGFLVGQILEKNRHLKTLRDFKNTLEEIAYAEYTRNKRGKEDERK